MAKSTAQAGAVTRAEYDEMIARIEDLEDRLALRESRSDPDREVMAGDMMRRILAGENRVKVWREYRGLTLRKLAEKAGLAPSYLSEIEAGQKPGSVRMLRALAAALDVEVEHLIPRG